LIRPKYTPAWRGPAEARARVHEPEPRLRSLIGLLFVCGLEPAILLPAERKTLHARAQAIALRDPVSDAVRPCLPIGPAPNKLF